jgi:enoyl-CoA hydratase/methylglutaconyl-CoA hydratase
MSETPTELVHYDVADGVATITLDSPHNRNALSRQLVTELVDRLERAAKDDAARVVVLRSADRVFCSGADLAEAAQGGVAGAEGLVGVLRGILTHPKPVVTRIVGPVRAGGLGIVGASDIVICGDDVTFALTESRLGLAPAMISLTLLPRMTSRAAADTFLTGRTFTADEAAAMGLVTRTAPADQVDTAVAASVGELLKAHPQGLAESKKVLSRDIVAYLDANAEEMAALSARLFASDAAKEAMLAFLSKK